MAATSTLSFSFLLQSLLGSYCQLGSIPGLVAVVLGLGLGLVGWGAGAGAEEGGSTVHHVGRITRAENLNRVGIRRTDRRERAGLGS